MTRMFLVTGVAAAVAATTGCKTSELSGGGAQVATSQSAPVDSGWDPEGCQSLGYIVGRGGGSFGGGWLSNEKLIEYAMNDLRNKAAELGANFIQHDTPTMGQAGSNGDTSTTTATVSGTAYLCERKANRVASTSTVQQAPPKATTPGCTPGSTQACVGPGGCQGGQFCVDDGTRYSPCDCGSAAERTPAPEETASEAL